MKKGLMVLSLLALLLVSVLSVAGSVSTISEADVTVTSVEANGHALSTSSSRNIERSTEVKVEVAFVANNDVDPVQIEAVMRGYDHDDLIEDITDAFSMKAGSDYVKTLTLKFPRRLSTGKYDLKLRFDSQKGSFEKVYEIDVDTPRHSLRVDDVVFSPAYGVEAGRALLTTVRVENFGQKDEGSTKVSVAIPELQIKASDFVEEINDGKRKTSEELYLRIPNCATPGEYEAVVTVEYDDGDEKTTSKYPITVLEGGVCDKAPAQAASKTVITVASEAQTVTRGEGGAIYPLTLSNTGTAAKTFTVTAGGADWADLRVSPTNVVVVEGGQSKALYVYVSAKESASAGAHTVALKVESEGRTLWEGALNANVADAAGAEGSWKKPLEVVLVVLVVLLVILGLVIGFNKLKGNGEEPEAGQTYY
jgi:uncharacterized membrane protein